MGLEDRPRESEAGLIEAATQIAEMRAVLTRAEEWWLREGKYAGFYGAPEWIFAARAILARMKEE